MGPTMEKLQCRISYRGDFGPDAEKLAQAMSQVTGERPVIRREAQDAELGMEHLVLTILASAALKAAFSVALDELKKYLIDMVRRRKEKNRVGANASDKAVVILDIKGLALKHSRPQLDLENLEETAVEEFIGQVREGVLDAAKSEAKA
jgi:hypothetical protein